MKCFRFLLSMKGKDTGKSFTSRMKPSTLYLSKVSVPKTDWRGGWNGASGEVRKPIRSIIQEHMMVFLPSSW